MPLKAQYVQDLMHNPDSTAGDAAKRLQVSEAAAAQTFKRCKAQGLVKCDDTQPPRFSLTEDGVKFLQQPNSNGTVPVLSSVSVNGNAAQNPALQFAQALANLIQASSPARHESESAAGLPDDAELLLEKIADLEEENAGLEAKIEKASELVAPVEVLELYAVELALSRILKRALRERRDALLEAVSEEWAQVVSDLVSLEDKLDDEQAAFFGGDDEKVESLQSQINSLREKLGLPAEEFAHGDSGKTESAAAEDANGERPKKHGKWL
jgi:hypothetical protein